MAHDAPIEVTGQTAAGAPLVVTIKAGHNAENHNQNDIASFMVHVEGENLLTGAPSRWAEAGNAAGWQGAKDAGRMRAEGKEYVVKDGDVMNFLFSS